MKEAPKPVQEEAKPEPVVEEPKPAPVAVQSEKSNEMMKSYEICNETDTPAVAPVAVQPQAETGFNTHTDNRHPKMEKLIADEALKMQRESVSIFE